MRLSAQRCPPLKMKTRSSAPPPTRAVQAWTVLFIAIMILACLAAVVATALYLNGAYLDPSVPQFSP